MICDTKDCGGEATHRLDFMHAEGLRDGEVANYLNCCGPCTAQWLVENPVRVDGWLFTVRATELSDALVIERAK